MNNFAGGIIHKTARHQVCIVSGRTSSASNAYRHRGSVLLFRRKILTHECVFGVFGALNSVRPPTLLVGSRLWRFLDAFVVKLPTVVLNMPGDIDHIFTFPLPFGREIEIAVLTENLGEISTFGNRSTSVAQVHHKAMLGISAQACVLPFSLILLLHQVSAVFAVALKQ